MNDWLLLVLRVSLALLMMTHGYPKLEKLLSGSEIKFYDFLFFGPKISYVLCIIGEFVAPIFIILGFQTKIASTISAFTMLVAAFGAHLSDPLADKEHSLLLAIGFIFILTTGGGNFNISALFGKKTNN